MQNVVEVDYEVVVIYFDVYLDMQKEDLKDFVNRKIKVSVGVYLNNMDLVKDFIKENSIYSKRKICIWYKLSYSIICSKKP